MHKIVVVVHQARPRAEPFFDFRDVCPVVPLFGERRVDCQIKSQILSQFCAAGQVKQYALAAVVLQITLLIVKRSRERIVQPIRCAAQCHIVLLMNHPAENVFLQIIFP